LQIIIYIYFLSYSLLIYYYNNIDEQLAGVGSLENFTERNIQECDTLFDSMEGLWPFRSNLGTDLQSYELWERHRLILDLGQKQQKDKKAKRKQEEAQGLKYLHKPSP